jgi:ubiquitin-activating enzyme E1
VLHVLSSPSLFSLSLCFFPGAETTAKLTKLRVIIVGLRGVGVETAKNLSLQGVGAITLVDPTPVAIHDVGVNFFIHETDIAGVRCEP